MASCELKIDIIDSEQYSPPPRQSTMKFDENEYLWLTDLDMKTPITTKNNMEKAISADSFTKQAERINRFYQRKKYGILQSFRSHAIEAEFQRYWQHHYVALIYIYLVSYFIINISSYWFYDRSKTHKNIFIIDNTLFIRIIISIFILIFGFIFWLKLLVRKQHYFMIAFNIFIAISELIISFLNGSTQYEIFMILIICIHLFSGINHFAASIICWCITLISYNNLTYIKFSYLCTTSLSFSLFSIFVEINRRKEFHQLQKLQFIKTKSKESLSMVLPPDASNWLRKGRRLAISFKYQLNHPQYRGVSLMFAEICDFDKLVSRLPANNLISVLNNIFSEWDKYASLHKIFKLKTINEIYIAAGGLQYPECDSNDDPHAIRMIFYANDIMHYNRKILEVYDDVYGQHIYLKIRIGLNIGPVMAAVIGQKLPRYDLFGDTVNVAARMKSTCKSSEIQMTTAFYDALPKSFHRFITKRENVKVKGKGEMNTYLLQYIDRTQVIEFKEEQNIHSDVNKPRAKRYRSISAVQEPELITDMSGLLDVLLETKCFDENDDLTTSLIAKESDSLLQEMCLENKRYT